MLLKDYLNGHTKEQLLDYARDFELKNCSGLRKAALVERIMEYFCSEEILRSRIVCLTEEEMNIFYWFTAAKKMFSKMFYHLFKPINSDYTPIHPTLEQLQTSMDTQIRALTGGDITKEKEVLKMDCWRALTELNAKAKDYQDIKKNIHI